MSDALAEAALFPLRCDAGHRVVVSGYMWEHNGRVWYCPDGCGRRMRVGAPLDATQEAAFRVGGEAALAALRPAW